MKAIRVDMKTATIEATCSACGHNWSFDYRSLSLQAHCPKCSHKIERQGNEKEKGPEETPTP
jgi:DNA-directed RNA polymerase subunit RPC12/RpoP